MNTAPKNNTPKGVSLAILAAFIWSGNFVVAKRVTAEIAPISLNTYRWLLASVVILPFAWKKLRPEWPVIKQSIPYLFWVALSGIALFNTFVYVGAHYTTAINLALIGTTSSPVMAIILARVLLKEPVSYQKLVGMLLCITGVLFLLSKGDFRNLRHFHFSEGDLWVLLAAFSFAVYNTLVKKRPTGISPMSFLFVVFAIGTTMMIPFFIWENSNTPAVEWNTHLILSIAYLGIAASAFCFMIWNLSIGILGAGRTALFGNLIPVFSSIEAALFLREDFTKTHIISMAIVFAGIIVANGKARSSTA